MSITESSGNMFRGSGFWSKRTKCQKSSIILTPLSVIVVVVVVCCVVFINNEKDVICQTHVCESEASKILSHMNSSVDPCDDFYEFACGNFSNINDLPPDKSRLATFDVVADSVLDRLKEVFNQIASQSKDEQKKTPKPIKFISEFFKICYESSDDLNPLHKLISELGGWPVAGIQPKSPKWSWKDTLLSIVADLGEGVLISVMVTPNPTNTSSYALTLDQPTFGVGRTELVNYKNDTKSRKVVDAYKKYLMETAQLLGKKEHSINDQDVENIIGFEIALATASTPPEDRRDHRTSTVTMDVKTLNSQVSNWYHSFLQDIFTKINSSDDITEDDYVIVMDLKYLKQIDSITSQLKNDTIQNYLIWRILHRIGYLSTPKFRMNEFEFKKVQLGIEKPVDMDKRCMDAISETVPDLMGRTYIDHFFTSEEKDSANVMITAILEAFRLIVQEKDWMDDETRQNSLIKANKILVNTAYPEWIRNDTALEVMYDFGKASEDNTIDAIVEIFKVLTKKMFDRLRKPVDRDREWPMGSATVNAAYDPAQNSITIPAAILQDVFYNMSRPNYLNFGAIGAVIGHEITHGFDDEGAQFDAEGNLKNWWTSSTEEKFTNKSQCFVDQYGSINDTRVNLLLNGRNTLGENIADNGGIREALLAYRLKGGRDPLLPGLQFTREQLFFISYANTWCSLTRNEKLRQAILYDPHSPPKYRVNVPLANYDEFAKVWKCSPESRMRKQEACVLW